MQQNSFNYVKEYARIKNNLKRLCEKLDANKHTQYKNVTCINDLNSVPSKPGVYWIETTMPVAALSQAAISIIGTPKTYNTIDHLLVRQSNNNYYLAYLGTEKNLRARLKQHLFNTTKSRERLGCDLSQQPFSSFSWRIWYFVIQDETIRYAVESWWLHNQAHPPFCLRKN